MRHPFRHPSICLGIILIAIAALHSCMVNSRKSDTSFDKYNYLRDCGISTDETLFTDDLIDSVLNYGVDCFPQFSELLEAAILNCPQSTIDTIMELKGSNPSSSLILNRYILPNSPNLCKLVCMRFPQYFSLKAYRYKNKQELDSLLMNYFFIKGVQLLDDPQVIIGMALAFSAYLPYDIKKQTGISSFNLLDSGIKDGIDSSLLVLSLSRIIQGMNVNTEEGLSSQQASEILDWGIKGEKYFSSFTDTPVYYNYYELLANSSLMLNHPNLSRYSDTLVTIFDRGYRPTLREYRKLFYGPLLNRYNQLLNDKSYNSALKVINCIINTLDSVKTDKGYIPAREIVEDRVPLDYKYETGQHEWAVRLLEKGITDNRLKVSPSDYVACCFEKARLLYLLNDSLYEEWLNTAFCYGVREAFPSMTLEDIDMVLSPEHQYVSGLIPLLQLQYNNRDARSVYDAALFIKGTSDIIPPSIYNAIKAYGDVSVISYADSIRHSLVSPHSGEAHDILENNIGPRLKQILNTCLTSWEDIRNGLSDDEIAVEFIACPSLSIPQTTTYKAVLVSKSMDLPVVVDLCDSDDLSGLIKADTPSFRALYKLIWEPLANYTNEYRTIYYAPDGLLNVCNLQAAVNPNGDSLMDIKDLHLLSSTREITTGRESRHISSIALFGGLDYTSPYQENIASKETLHPSLSKTINRSFCRGEFNYLPYTMKEVESISSISSAHNVSSILYSGDDGSEEAFYSLENKQIDALHLATHGFYYSKDLSSKNSFINDLMQRENPLSRCGLIMAGGQNAWKGQTVPNNCEDGVLLGTEILGMDFSDVDIVVLSACCTALGDISGEGVSGLRQAFRRAGASSLLITIGNVDDEASCFFMESFYNGLMGGKNKQDAYYQAITEMRNHKRFKKPRYWTKYILIE